MKKLTSSEQNRLQQEFNCFDVEIFLRASGAVLAAMLGLAFIVESIQRNDSFGSRSVGEVICVIISMFLFGAALLLLASWFGDAIGFLVAELRTRYIAFRLGLKKEDIEARNNKRRQNLPIIWRIFLQK